MENNIKFSTLGCRLNSYETESMRNMAGTVGLNNAVIINTCAVTHQAVSKSRQEIRRLRRENPNSTLIGYRLRSSNRSGEFFKNG